MLALYRGEIETGEQVVLGSVNALVAETIENAPGLQPQKQEALKDALQLTGADFNRLAPYMTRVVAILKRLNIRSVLNTDTDFLGIFYEAFLRYGYDNNALGIVFTPRHITRLAVDLLGAGPTDRVVDVACGTGGFLVAAFDAMLGAAQSAASVATVKESIYGFDTNPTVWALSTLNMFFRGDGKSHIENADCFEPESRAVVHRTATRAFLNPPFSQDEEPERDFIDASMDALAPEGTLGAVVYAGVFADDEHRVWRNEFLRRHTLLGMISLPEDLFYPTAAPTSLMLAQAHVPQSPNSTVFMARIWNDGFEKLKGRRIETDGDQLPEIRQAFQAFRAGDELESSLTTLVPGRSILQGQEWSPQQWLPQPIPSAGDLSRAQQDIISSLFRAIARFPDLADEVLVDLAAPWEGLPDLPLGVSRSLEDLFEIRGGRSGGEKNYQEGTSPYVSSGDSTNSIVNLVEGVEAELFENGGISLTAFGAAAIQPWPFMARGNGGSAVRVLIPKFKMSLRDLVWFAAQINLQRWRFFYARMAIASRSRRLIVDTPPTPLPDDGLDIAGRIDALRNLLVTGVNLG